jgi:hypothetical protein
MDDFEVTELDQGSGEEDAPGPDARFHLSQSPTPARDPLAPRRARRVRGLVALGLMLLIAAALLASIPGTQAGVVAALHLPSPVSTATLAAGADTFFLTNAVPWGTAQVDKHTLPIDPTAALAGAFHLTRGRHTLTYVAPPFHVLRCQVSVPAARSDTCPLVDAAAMGYSGLLHTPRVLDLRATLQRLPADQLVSLKQAIEAALAFTEPAAILPGDHYGTDAGIVVATQPLTGTLTYRSDSGAALSCAPGAGCVLCVQLCTPPNSLGGIYWHLQAQMRLGWRYAKADGTVIATGTPFMPAADVPSADASVRFPLGVYWAGQWTVTTGYGDTEVGSDLMIGAAMDNLSVQLTQPSSKAYGHTSITARNPADGCLMYRFVDASHQPVNPPIEVLYRFGVLLAVTDGAHQLLPQAPLADAHEQSIANQIAASFLPPGA